MPGSQVRNWELYHKLIAEGKTKEEAARIANSVSKGFSSGFASKTSRKRKLMRSLKHRRRYPPPVKGGSGKRRAKP